LREAVRLLEFVGVVITRRGSGGGVIVAAPSQSATVQALASYIESRGVTPQHMFEVRRALELAAVDLAVTKIDADGEALLRDALEREGLDLIKITAQALHVRIAEITGNRVIHLFLYALTRLVEQHLREDIDVDEQEAQISVAHIHGAIVDAIVAGDRELARHRMTGHLAALMPHQR
jgi:DNA-binding FadR family transcriptional regulator